MNFKTLVWNRVVAENSKLVAEAMVCHRRNPEGDALGFLECDLVDMVENRLDEALGAWVVNVAWPADKCWHDYWARHAVNLEWPF